MIIELDWLLRSPADFRMQLRTLRAAITDDVPQAVTKLIKLAAHSLDINQLNRVAQTAAVFPKGSLGLRVVKLAILADGTQELIAPALAGSALRHGLELDITIADYGSMVQQALDPASPVRAAKPDFALVAADHRMLGLGSAQLGVGAAEVAVTIAFGHLKTVVEALQNAVSGGILVQTVVAPVEPLFGSYDAVEQGSVASMVASLNDRLARWAADRSIVLVDAARVASWVGLDHWTDPARWNAAKLPIALEAVPLYADIVARTLAAAVIGPKKCLVLDLDNTLWGGVIGDDGVEGITLGQGSGAGEAFVAIQRMALELRSRGVVLAVCSKNDEAVALLPFTQHPEMLLKTADIAVFQANWTDKASNLRAIATALNLGLDSLVFLDDNPAERDQVRRELPMVSVPELPDEPALYPRMLQCAGYFDTTAFLDEDRLRANNYAADAKRKAIILQAESSDLSGYLASLKMVCELRPFDRVGRARISQLSIKSNQYNLTTRRYTEAEVAAIETDAHKFSLQVRLADRFGDNGMISIVIFNTLGENVGGRDWVCESWLMSCRVLGRRVEEAVLAIVAAAARSAGADRLVGRYLPTVKNAMVANHFSRLGFTLVSAGDDGQTDWILELASYEAPELPMQLTGLGDFR